MSQFEIEIKSLLGVPEQAMALKQRMRELDPSCRRISQNAQLNHYFEVGDALDALYQAVAHLFAGAQHDRFRSIATQGSDFSIRTRQKDNEILLVIKAAIDGGTSSNGVQRMEFEEPVGVSLAELDELLLGAGHTYQAKWSREREEYTYKGINVCIDKNAGYGYLAEFEKVVHDAREAEAARAKVVGLMEELGVSELPQDRLARMFAHYNANWSDYYGTDNVFVIE